jgi:hypothetical protein
MARFGEPEEKMFIETLVAKFAVEAFNEGVLHRLAGLDVVPGHRSAAQRRTALLVSSVSLSLTMVWSQPR